MKTCQARIVDEYKTRKADSVWPVAAYGGEADPLSLPECGGNLTLETLLGDDGGCSDPECCGGANYHVALELTCSRCQYPYHKDVGENYSGYGGEKKINEILKEWMERDEARPTEAESETLKGEGEPPTSRS